MNQIKKYLTSMQFWLMLVIFLLGSIPVIVLGVGAIRIVDRDITNQKIDKIKNQANVLRNHLAESGYQDGKLTEAALRSSLNSELNQLANTYSARIEVTDADFQVIYDNYLVDQGKINISGNVLSCFEGKNYYNYNRETKLMEVDLAVSREGEEAIDGVISIVYHTDEIANLLNEIKDSIYMIETLFLFAVLGLAILFSRFMVQPFRKIEKSLEQVNAGNLSDRIKLSGYSETERITEALNEMLNRLEELDNSRSEFVSNVSHELKTPITSIKVLVDSLLTQEGVPEEMYREFLQDISLEIDRESAIITDLLTLVRLDKSVDSLNVSMVNINESIELILKRLRPIAAKKNIELVLESFRPVLAEVDEVKFGLVITNLVENAIKYNRIEGWVHISLNADHQYFYLKVSDSGIGMSEDELGKIFERFYRVDKARTREGDEVSGTGLGLAIARRIVVMHNGAIKVFSKPEEGTTFTVRMPLTFVRKEQDHGKMQEEM